MHVLRSCLALAIALAAMTLAAGVARAECWSSDDIHKILGVATDGRFVSAHATRRAAGADLDDNREHTSYELSIVASDGSVETTIARGENDSGAWQSKGKPLPPAVLAGNPTQATLESRVVAFVRATAPLVPTERDVHIIKGETTYRVLLDKALVKMMKVKDPADDLTSAHRWTARVFAHPSAPLVFLALSSHAQPRQGCTINVEAIDWLPSPVEPHDDAVASTFCAEEFLHDEQNFSAQNVDEAARADDAFDRDDPFTKWVACTKETAGDAYLQTIAARVATLDGLPRVRLLRAVAHTVESTWAPLVKMANSKDADQRTFAVLALTSLDLALRKNSVHGEKRDPTFRAALQRELKALCAANPESNLRESAAVVACEAELARVPHDKRPDEEPCHPGACVRQLVGVASDGRFVVEQRRGRVAFELRAPGGDLLLRIGASSGDSCTGKKCALRWDVDGPPAGVANLIALTTTDPKPEKLREAIVKLLDLSPAHASPENVVLKDHLVRIGQWIVAPLESDVATLTPLEHAASALVFVDSVDGSAACKEPDGCRLVVWGPRPVANPNDFAALAQHCEKVPDADERADCLGSILDERVYPMLIQYARSDGNARLDLATARIATALGRRPLIERATSSDSFKRQWALYGLAQVLEDTTERLPFSGRAPDKRRAALIAEIEPVCKRALADRDLVVAGGAIACLAQTNAKLDLNRLREVLRSPSLNTRSALFPVAVREGALANIADLQAVASWLKEPIDKRDQDEQEWLHGEVCSFFVTALRPAHKKWLRPLVEARLKTLTLRPDAKGACRTLLELL